MRHVSILLLLAFVLMAAGVPLNGRTIAHQGNGHGAMACDTCHAAHFQGNPAIRAPAIAGLPKAEILARLAHYAGPSGHNAMMRQVATSLTPSEREAVAAYLSSLKPAH